MESHLDNELNKFNRKIDKMAKPLLEECSNIRMENDMLTKEMKIM